MYTSRLFSVRITISFRIFSAFKNHHFNVILFYVNFVSLFLVMDSRSPVELSLNLFWFIIEVSLVHHRLITVSNEVPNGCNLFHWEDSARIHFLVHILNLFYSDGVAILFHIIKYHQKLIVILPEPNKCNFRVKRLLFHPYFNELFPSIRLYARM